MIAEVIGYYDPTIATAAGFMAVETGWGFTIDRYCSETVREKYIKPAIKGEKFVGIATAEPAGGSDSARADLNPLLTKKRMFLATIKDV